MDEYLSLIHRVTLLKQASGPNFKIHSGLQYYKIQNGLGTQYDPLIYCTCPGAQS